MAIENPHFLALLPVGQLELMNYGCPEHLLMGKVRLKEDKKKTEEEGKKRRINGVEKQPDFFVQLARKSPVALTVKSGFVPTLRV